MINEVNEPIKVSVLCMVYNHQKYLRRCLEGMVNQKTSFMFEIIVHDDSSTDGSRIIIEEYVSRYPEIFVPIFQKENQFSKHGGNYIIDKIMFKKSKGQYIAFCEGDDYWCSCDKLQLQYDYMEKHSNVSICLHNSLYHYLNRNKRDKRFNKWKTIHKLTEDEIFGPMVVHMSSFFARRTAFVLPELNLNCIYSDYQRLTWAYNMGDVVSLPYVMSIYNSGVNGGMMEMQKKSNKQLFENIQQQVNYLKRYDELTKYQYSSTIHEYMRYFEFSYYIQKSTYPMLYGQKDEALKAVKEVVSHPYYKNYMHILRKQSHCKYFKAIVKYRGYHLYNLWHYALKLCS